MPSGVERSPVDLHIRKFTGLLSPLPAPRFLAPRMLAFGFAALRSTFADIVTDFSRFTQNSRMPSQHFLASLRIRGCRQTCEIRPQVTGENGTTCGKCPQVTAQDATTCGKCPQVTAQNVTTCGKCPQVTAKTTTTCGKRPQVTAQDDRFRAW